MNTARSLMIGVCVIYGCAEGASAPEDNPTLQRLTAEAATLARESPDVWHRYELQISNAFATQEKATHTYRSRSAPEIPDLNGLKLPLPLLVDDLLKLRQPSKTTSFPWVRHQAYIDAIVHHPDERRIDALVEYRNWFQKGVQPYSSVGTWNTTIMKAASEQWAERTLPVLLKADPEPSPEKLPYLLLQRFATQLSAINREAGYRYIHSQVTAGPSDDVSGDAWEILTCLNPTRAREELINAFGK